MSELMQLSNLVPLEETNANQEFDRIISDSRISDVLKEISRFRIWRLHKTGNWRNIIDAGGNVLYNTWEEVIQNLSEILDCGRQQLYDRVRVYEQLHWLGYSDQESIEMVAEKPYLYAKTLDLVVDWNQREEKPRRVLIPQMANATEAEAKEHLRGLLSDVESFDKQKDALKFVSESVLAEPQLELWYNGDIIRCTYFRQAIDEAGDVHVEDYGSVTFYPDTKLPAWAQDRLEKTFRSMGRYKEDVDTAQSLTHTDKQ